MVQIIVFESCPRCARRLERYRGYTIPCEDCNPNKSADLFRASIDSVVDRSENRVADTPEDTLG